MKTKKSRGTAGIILVLLVVCAGVLGMLFWQGIVHNYKELSGKLNESLSGLLSKEGIGGAAVIDAASSEHHEGFTVWREYYRKIQLTKQVDLKALAGRIENAARAYHLNIVNRAGGDGTLTIEIARGDKVLAHLVFVLAARKTELLKPPRRFALVIDDLGGKRDLSPLIDLGVPLTFAIMPYERFSKEIAGDLTGRRMPYIMHLPLEPEAYPKIDPGKAALFIKMSDEEIRRKFAKDLATVPGVAGVSNHMGSRFSADPQKMKVLLELVKTQGLYYFDSYTTPRSQAGAVAKIVDIPFRVNGLFVDLEDTPEFMSKQFDLIIKKFEHVDEFIAIGHIQKKSLPAVLRDYIPKFKKAGIEFVYLSDLIKS